MNYPAFLLTGMFVFTYTQRRCTAGAKSISGNLSLIRALHFPRAALPLAYTHPGAAAARHLHGRAGR